MPGLLIVDDTPIIRSTIIRVVEREGLDFDPVVEAKNGVEAVDFARRDRPDLILMDIKIPGIDGLEASALIRADLPHTRIIFLTAYDEFVYVQRALKLGALDYLLKPIPPDKLAEILAHAYDQIVGERSEAPEQNGAALPPPGERDAVQRAVAYIRQNFASPTISLGEVSGVAHLSPSHLAHRFKESVGSSYKQFLTEQRIEAAKTLLQTTNLTIDAIAERVGYQNVTNFYRLFQRETGATPAAFRRTNPSAAAEAGGPMEPREGDAG